MRTIDLHVCPTPGTSVSSDCRLARRASERIFRRCVRRPQGGVLAASGTLLPPHPLTFQSNLLRWRTNANASVNSPEADEARADGGGADEAPSAFGGRRVGLTIGIQKRSPESLYGLVVGVFCLLARRFQRSVVDADVRVEFRRNPSPANPRDGKISMPPSKYEVDFLIASWTRLCRNVIRHRVVCAGLGAPIRPTLKVTLRAVGEIIIIFLSSRGS